MRRRKRNSLKLGFIFIISIFSLACINVSYSGFTDYLQIYGYVETWEEPASIGDYVWNDINRDGINDIGELGIPEVIVNIYYGNGTFLNTTTTDITGYYLFYNLSPGDYFIEFILPEGYFFTIQDSGIDDELDSDADTTTGQTITTILKPGDNDIRWDAGMYTDYEGCTGGFWKNFVNEWIGYSPGQTLGEVFKFRPELSDLISVTFLDSLSFSGGNTLLDKAKNLMRVSVAALLNAAHPDVNYPFSEAEIINNVNIALLSLDPIIIEYQMLILDYNNCLQACLCP